MLDELARRRLVVVPDDAVWRTGTRRGRLRTTTLGYNHPGARTNLPAMMIGYRAAEFLDARS